MKLFNQMSNIFFCIFKVICNFGNCFSFFKFFPDESTFFFYSSFFSSLLLPFFSSLLSSFFSCLFSLYIGRAYERLVPPRSRYKKKIVFLPTPEFYTFYNGKEKWEKEKELRLSDAYIVKDGEPSLELKVKVINIRPEEHHEILEKCQVLKEYSQFMEIVQNYQISGEEEPYKKAIKECIEKGILADYLMRKGSEVVNMLLDEYDYETDIEVQREEAREQGREEGRKQGREEGRKAERSTLIQKKLEKGKTISQIADELEDTEENIACLIEQFHLRIN